MALTMTPEQTKDMAFIRNPNNWPAWPFLPIKRYVNHRLECATIWRGALPKNCGALILFEANIFNLPSTLEEFHQTAKHCYRTIEEAVEDGWIVD